MMPAWRCGSPISRPARPRTWTRVIWSAATGRPAWCARRSEIGLGGLGVVAISVNIFFRSAALASFHDKGWARFYRLIDQHGCWAELIPIDGNELWRLTVFDQPASAQAPESLLRQMAGGEFPYEILSVTRWERRDFVAQSYGNGRVMIAGDAAHECSPTGGIGMHTGLEEAVNLGWKLAAMVEGWGGAGSDRLLRGRAAADRAAQRGIGDPLVPRHRRHPGPCPSGRDRLAGDAQLAVDPGASQDSSLLRGLADLHPGRDACARPGTAALHAVHPAGRARPACLARRRQLHARSVRRRLYLLRLGERPPDAGALLRAAQARRVPLREVAITDPEVAALYEHALVLVRPDGHVAWRGDAPPADAAGIVERMRGAATPAQTQERTGAFAVEEQR